MSSQTSLDGTSREQPTSVVDDESEAYQYSVAARMADEYAIDDDWKPTFVKQTKEQTTELVNETTLQQTLVSSDEASELSKSQKDEITQSSLDQLQRSFISFIQRSATSIVEIYDTPIDDSLSMTDEQDHARISTSPVESSSSLETAPKSSTIATSAFSLDTSLEPKNSTVLPSLALLLPHWLSTRQSQTSDIRLEAENMESFVFVLCASATAARASAIASHEISSLLSKEIRQSNILFTNDLSTCFFPDGTEAEFDTKFSEYNRGTVIFISAEALPSLLLYFTGSPYKSLLGAVLVSSSLFSCQDSQCASLAYSLALLASNLALLPTTRLIITAPIQTKPGKEKVEEKNGENAVKLCSILGFTPTTLRVYPSAPLSIPSLPTISYRGVPVSNLAQRVVDVLCAEHCSRLPGPIAALLPTMGDVLEVQRLLQASLPGLITSGRTSKEGRVLIVPSTISAAAARLKTLPGTSHKKKKKTNAGGLSLRPSERAILLACTEETLRATLSAPMVMLGFSSLHTSSSFLPTLSSLPPLRALVDCGVVYDQGIDMPTGLPILRIRPISSDQFYLRASLTEAMVCLYSSVLLSGQEREEHEHEHEQRESTTGSKTEKSSLPPVHIISGKLMNNMLLSMDVPMKDPTLLSTQSDAISPPILPELLIAFRSALSEALYTGLASTTATTTTTTTKLTELSESMESQRTSLSTPALHKTALRSFISSSDAEENDEDLNMSSLAFHISFFKFILLAAAAGKDVGQRACAMYAIAAVLSTDTFATGFLAPCSPLTGASRNSSGYSATELWALLDSEQGPLYAILSAYEAIQSAQSRLTASSGTFESICSEFFLRPSIVTKSTYERDKRVVCLFCFLFDTNCDFFYFFRNFFFSIFLFFISLLQLQNT